MDFGPLCRPTQPFFAALLYCYRVKHHGAQTYFTGYKTLLAVGHRKNNNRKVFLGGSASPSLKELDN